MNESLEHPLIIPEPMEFAQLPFIVVSHGGARMMANYVPLLDASVATGFAVAAPTRRGHNGPGGCVRAGSD
ncbi:MAG: hypothetical protein CMQ29_14950 [Gammaproteobacteria bacterium]|nr:hypothetical protein [Gammaproteobacteria bacterium]